MIKESEESEAEMIFFGGELIRYLDTIPSAIDSSLGIAGLPQESQDGKIAYGLVAVLELELSFKRTHKHSSWHVSPQLSSIDFSLLSLDDNNSSQKQHLMLSSDFLVRGGVCVLEYKYGSTLGGVGSCLVVDKSAEYGVETESELKDLEVDRGMEVVLIDAKEFAE